MAKKKQPAKGGQTVDTAARNEAGSGQDGDGQAAGAATGQNAAAGQQTPQGAQLNVLAQYIKDLSFESPNAPKSLHGPGNNPKLQVNVRVDSERQEESVYEVLLNIEANATSDIGVIYNVELVYGALFRLANIPENYMHPVLFIDCPTIIFPFARRVVADLTHDGSFPPLLLDPIDFASLYRQNVEQQQGQPAQA